MGCGGWSGLGGPMVLAASTDKTAYGYLDPVVISITGGVASTAYTVAVTDANGHTVLLNATTDGSGAATVKAVNQTHRGALAVSVRPTAEYTGKTAAAVSITTRGA